MVSRRMLACLFGTLTTILVQGEYAGAQGLETVEVKIASRALRGNAIGDPKKRPVTVYLPPTYHQTPHRSYPVVYMLPGFGMYRMEDTINRLPQLRDPLPPALVPDFQNFTFDMDGIARQMMETHETPEFILVEVSGVTSYGGGWYDCSEVFGDLRTFVARDVVERIDNRFRTIPQRNNRFLVGFSMGSYGGLRMGIEYHDLFGGLALLSPAPTDFSWVRPGGTLPRLLELFGFSTQVPLTGLPVDQPFSDDTFRAFWGPRPLSGKFFEDVFWSFDQVTSPLLSNPDPGSPFHFAEASMVGSEVHWDIWERRYQESLVTSIAEDHAALARTPIFIGRGDNGKVPFHPEPGDVVQLTPALDAAGVQYTSMIAAGHDHFTSVPTTFRAGVKFLFEKAGSQDDRPTVAGTQLGSRHAVCAAKFPRHGHGNTNGEDEDDDTDDDND